MFQLVEIKGKVNEKGCIEIPVVLLEQTGIRTGEEVKLLYLAAGEKDFKNESKEFLLVRAGENPAGELMKEENVELRLPPEPEDPVRRRTSGRQRRASLEEYRETYLAVPKIRNRKTVFVSEDVRDELDAIVRRLGGRGMSVSGLLENLAREHLAAYREDIEQWRKI